MNTLNATFLIMVTVLCSSLTSPSVLAQNVKSVIAALAEVNNVSMDNADGSVVISAKDEWFGCRNVLYPLGRETHPLAEDTAGNLCKLFGKEVTAVLLDKRFKGNPRHKCNIRGASAVLLDDVTGMYSGFSEILNGVYGSANFDKEVYYNNILEIVCY